MTMPLCIINTLSESALKRSEYQGLYAITHSPNEERQLHTKNTLLKEKSVV
jgi:hypothetical protein